jgi:hypothetical protein
MFNTLLINQHQQFDVLFGFIAEQTCTSDQQIEQSRSVDTKTYTCVAHVNQVSLDFFRGGSFSEACLALALALALAVLPPPFSSVNALVLTLGLGPSPPAPSADDLDLVRLLRVTTSTTIHKTSIYVQKQIQYIMHKKSSIGH